MKVFKANPEKIFPFQVDGCSRFKNRSSCTLVDAAPVEGTGRVWVTSNATSVTFTVTSNGNFDPPGSRITFSTYEENGSIFLQQEGSARQVNFFVARGVDLGFAYNTWSDQASQPSRLLQ